MLCAKTRDASFRRSTQCMQTLRRFAHGVVGRGSCRHIIAKMRLFRLGRASARYFTFVTHCGRAREFVCSRAHRGETTKTSLPTRSDCAQRFHGSQAKTRWCMARRDPSRFSRAAKTSCCLRMGCASRKICSNQAEWRAYVQQMDGAKDLDSAPKCKLNLADGATSSS